MQAIILHDAGHALRPVTRAAEFNTPILILYGTADGPAGGGSANTDVALARDFEAALRRNGKSVEANYYQGGGHNTFFTNSTQRDDYEKGHINRRQLIGGLMMLAAGSEAAFAVPTYNKAMSIDHIAINVSDVKKSTDFYHDVFGMSVTMQNEKSAALLFNNIGLIIRPGKNPGTISHFMMGVDNYHAEKMAAELKSHALDPRKDQDSFHVKDPDGLDVQIGDKDMRGSSQAPTGQRHLTSGTQEKN